MNEAAGSAAPWDGGDSSRRWRLAFAVMLASFMGSSALVYVSLAVLGPFIRQDLGVSLARIGLLASASQLVGAMASPYAGKLVDRFGARRFVFVGATISATAIVSVSAAATYVALLLACALAGFAGAFSNPVTNRLITENLGPGRRGVVLGFKQSGVQMAVLFVGVVIPFVAVRTDWRVAVLTGLMFGVVATTFAAALLRGSEASRRPRSDRHGVVFRADRPLRLLATYTLVMGVAMSATSTYLPLYSFDALDFTAVEAGRTTAIAGAVGVFARMGWGRLAERARVPIGTVLRRISTVQTLAVLSLASAGVLAASDARHSVVATVLFTSLTVNAAAAVGWNIVAMMYLVQGSRHTVTGASTGYVQRASFTGLVIGPVCFGTVVQTTGHYGSGWAVVAALTATGMVVASRLSTADG